MRFARTLSALVLSIFFVSSLFAQTVSAQTASVRQDSDRPKVAVVLSGGGAKGFAHIALLEALEEEGIPIDLITGTSMGALVGSFYASGYSAKEIRQLICDTDMINLILDPAAVVTPIKSQAFDETTGNLITYPISKSGIGAAPSLLGDNKVLNFLASHLTKNCNIRNFDQLPIAFRAVGTDDLTFEEVVFSEGSLLNAIRGSMSLPMLFTPFPTDDGRFVLDGGLVNNLPVLLARDLGADIVIAIDVASILSSDTSHLKTADDMGIHLFNLAISPNAVVQHPYADLLIVPDLSPYHTLSFASQEEIIDLGCAAVAEQRSAIHAIALQLEELGVELSPKDYNRVSIYASLPDPIVERIIVEDHSLFEPIPLPKPKDYSWLMDKPLTESQIKRLIAQLSTDRSKYNLVSLSFETRAGSTPETCTLALTCTHYITNPGAITVGGNPHLSIQNTNGAVSFNIQPLINGSVILKQPFEMSFSGAVGPSLTACISLSPTLAQIRNNQLSLKTDASLLYGGITPDDSYNYLGKSTLNNIGFEYFLGLRASHLHYATFNLGAAGNLFKVHGPTSASNTLVQSLYGSGSISINTLSNYTSDWKGFRSEAMVRYGASWVNSRKNTLWSAAFRQKQQIELVTGKTSVGYEFSLAGGNQPEILSSSWFDFGGYTGMCGYPSETLARNYVLAGIQLQQYLFSFFGMPTIAQFLVKTGMKNVPLPIQGNPFTGMEFGCGGWLMLDTPVGNVIAGATCNITSKNFTITLGLQ